MKKLFITMFIVAFFSGNALAVDTAPQEQQAEQAAVKEQPINQEPTKNDTSQEEKPKTDKKDDWTAAKVVGVVIAVPLVPVILVFEGVSWLYDQVVTPNNASAWGSVVGEAARR